jgi:hypothetical protein
MKKFGCIRRQSTDAQAADPGLHRHALHIEDYLVAHRHLQVAGEIFLNRDRRGLRARRNAARELPAGELLGVGQLATIGRAVFPPQRPAWHA